jgi:cyclic 2,3-diphosphoglycerate synthetase
MTRAIALIDGEHYAEVVRDALSELPYDFVGAHFVGGTEKLQGGDDYGVPLLEDLEASIGDLEPEAIVDLSDEPVLGPRERFRFASRALALGVPYVGADFRFDPPVLEPFDLPSIGIVGTGKRVGKTAVSSHAARLYARDRRVLVVAMGRGGPATPEVAEAGTSLERLLELAGQGHHAASDYLEDAALAGVDTIGCRRAGGGLAGAVVTSNVSEGARLATERGADLVLFEGSGAAMPPIATGRRVLVADASTDLELLTGYLNSYRILVSDLVVLTNAEDGTPTAAREAITAIKDVPIVATVMRPRPATEVTGKSVALFTTAPRGAHSRLADHLRREHDVDVVHISGNLANRDALRDELRGIQADVYLIEIKAAAIDVVAATAAERGVECVFVDNQVLPISGEPDLDAELQALAEAVAGQPVVAG